MTKITVRLEDSERDAIVKYAEENDLSMSWVIRKAIKDFLQSLENTD